MKTQLWPKTTTGKWSAILTLLFIIFMSLKFSALAIPIRLPLPTPFIAVIGVAGFIAGIMAIINKDRSLFVILSIPVGLLIIFWVAAEIAFPH
jgi:hypothetical protein